MFISTLISLSIYYFVLFGSINCFNLCGDWTKYEGFKCFKVIEKKANEEEALKLCTELDNTSTLVTIHSKDEQEFINRMVVKYNKNFNNLWIGMKYSNGSYRWMDGTVTDYTNWSDDAVKDGVDKCVQISLVGNTLNKWTDSSCNKPALVLCQKKPEINLNTLENLIESLSQQFANLSEHFEKQSENFAHMSEHLESKINLLSNNDLPPGFLYTQFPDQSSPNHLWPNLKWSDVTKQYSGLFFRAEGNGSELFGQIQQANQSWISKIGVQTFEYDSWVGSVRYFPKDFDFENNESMTTFVSDGGTEWTAINDLNITTTAAEVRPRNTAIKIWKRI